MLRTSNLTINDKNGGFFLNIGTCQFHGFLNGRYRTAAPRNHISSRMHLDNCFLLVDQMPVKRFLGRINGSTTRAIITSSHLSSSIEISYIISLEGLNLLKPFSDLVLLSDPLVRSGRLIISMHRAKITILVQRRSRSILDSQYISLLRLKALGKLFTYFLSVITLQVLIVLLVGNLLVQTQLKEVLLWTSFTDLI